MYAIPGIFHFDIYFMTGMAYLQQKYAIPVISFR